MIDRERRTIRQVMAAFALLAVASANGAARADVKTGVDAWAQGDYAKAIREWRGAAEAGDPDAQFNMGQAYKLGRGVPADLDQAMDWYRKAAAQGHARAEDNYGLLLFQQNRREEAMPLLERSAERGEPRAQYLVGTALFNGDLLSRDWVRAYAMMMRASASGLPQAARALAHMDQYIPDGQRRDGLALAEAMAQKEQAELALAGAPAPTDAAPVRATPKPLKGAPLPPSGSTATAQSQTAPASPAAKGNWRVQFGAFSAQGRADILWKSLSAKVPELAGYKPILVPGGGVTRLQTGPLSSEADAERLCGTVRRAGNDCLVKAM